MRGKNKFNLFVYCISIYLKEKQNTNNNINAI